MYTGLGLPSGHAQGRQRSIAHGEPGMVIHERTHDQKGAGKWDIGTTRYIPVGGGSRSRLPVADDPDYRRYPGFVGLDDTLSETVYTIATLYGYIKGAAVVLPGQEGTFTQLIIDEAAAKLKREKEELEERAKQGGARSTAEDE
jgi:hypothetical protein